MSEFVLTLVLSYHRDLDLYAQQQRRALWRLVDAKPAEATTVGIMGLGELGADAARRLMQHGLTVKGWSRSTKQLEGMTTHHGRDDLANFASEVDILVCLLPLTAATRRILNAALFNHLPFGARLINVGRGAHLVEADLIDALDTGRLAHATLDVFAEEPLPQGHPFWRHPRITITPHAASYSLPSSGADVVAENLRRLEAGEPLLHVVDRSRGY